jgi:hypothetical protein
MNGRHSLSSSTSRITNLLPLQLFVRKVENIYRFIYKLKPHYLRSKQNNTVHHYGNITRRTIVIVLLNLDFVFASHIVKHRTKVVPAISSSTFRIMHLLPLHLSVPKVGYIYTLIHKLKEHYLHLK